MGPIFLVICGFVIWVFAICGVKFCGLKTFANIHLYEFLLTNIKKYSIYCSDSGGGRGKELNHTTSRKPGTMLYTKRTVSQDGYLV